jgi:hypothetical protein
MARQALIPGGVYVNETATRQAQIPGHQAMNETVSVAGAAPKIIPESLAMAPLRNLGSGMGTQ